MVDHRLECGEVISDDVDASDRYPYPTDSGLTAESWRDHQSLMEGRSRGSTGSPSEHGLE
jgi:hypothetical protein